jgi:hypothetical protein
MLRRRVPGLLSWSACLFFFCGMAQAQDVPSGDQLEQLLAPIALYPDTLLAQICAAAGDPQQIIDADNWLKQNGNLAGTALTDAAQQQGFDPAFISLVTFPSVLDAMAENIDDYAAIGEAFKADQASVMAAIQTLRQQAYASGALDSNQYQNVSVEDQNGSQVVVVQPANPQVVYVPQYQPQQVFVAGPSAGDVVAASLLSFGAGIAIGALINDQPWGWRGWGWGWGGRGIIYRNNPWRFSYGYRSPRPYYRPRPPIYNRPIHARPPPNWNQRPGYRPPPYRPGNGRPPFTGRPPGNTRPPGNGGGRPPGNIRPPGNGGGRPPGNIRPPGSGDGRPPGNVRPPNNGGRPPGNTRPPGSGDGRPPGNTRPPGAGTRPPGNGGGAARPAPTPRPTPIQRPAPTPRPTPIQRPAPTVRPAPTPRPTSPARPAMRNPYAGFPQAGARPQPPARQPAPQVQRPSAPATGARPTALGGNNNGNAARAASNRGRQSSGAAPQGGRHR